MKKLKILVLILLIASMNTITLGSPGDGSDGNKKIDTISKTKLICEHESKNDGNGSPKRTG